MTAKLESHFIKYYSGDQVKEDEMGGACSTHGCDEKCIQNVGRKGTVHAEDLGVGGNISHWTLGK